MKKIKIAVAIFIISILSPINAAYAAGNCSRVVDKFTTIEYEWDCCKPGLVHATVKVKGVAVGDYYVSPNSVSCYSNCCPM